MHGGGGVEMEAVGIVHHDGKARVHVCFSHHFDKAQIQPTHGGKEVFGLQSLQSTIEGSQGKYSKQEMEARWSPTYWLAPRLTIS